MREIMTLPSGEIANRGKSQTLIFLSLLFLKTARTTTKKGRIFCPWQTPKILGEKREKRSKKQGIPCKRKKGIPKKQGKEDQERGGQNVSCDFDRGERTIECPLQNQFWRPQKVGFVWSVPVSSKEDDRARTKGGGNGP